MASTREFDRWRRLRHFLSKLSAAWLHLMKQIQDRAVVSVTSAPWFGGSVLNLRQPEGHEHFVRNLLRGVHAAL